MGAPEDQRSARSRTPAGCACWPGRLGWGRTIAKDDDGPSHPWHSRDRPPPPPTLPRKRRRELVRITVELGTSLHTAVPDCRADHTSSIRRTVSKVQPPPGVTPIAEARREPAFHRPCLDRGATQMNAGRNISTSDKSER